MNLSDFDFELPERLIAQEPLEDRTASRMLVVDRAAGTYEDRQFRDFPTYLHPGDCLVLNNSRVFPARLYGRRTGGGQVEALLLRPSGQDPHEWQALVRPGRRLRLGDHVDFDGGLSATIAARGELGERTLRFHTDRDLFAEFERTGHVPLPPYIKRADNPADRERYQTVFARDHGSAAAPTAGLHFTPAILDQCRAAGARVAFVTLHVGLGTFQPLRESQIETARLHSEHFRITAEDVAIMRAAGRLVCIGTTSVRTIETALRSGGPLEASEGDTDVFIQPGYAFRGVGAMLTNFHLPQTSLLLLVSAFAGRSLTLAAYRHAVSSGYRFYSYGDCMLIL